MIQERNAPRARPAMRFVLLVGILSFFADCTYEGARGVLGPYLSTGGASATIIGVVMGLGELLGYGLRAVSGAVADFSRRFWPITIVGYIVQMASVPALALTHDWRSAALLVIAERVGKAIRNPPRDVMLANAAQHIGGYGWVFGIHEAFDQFGAMVGPLVVAAVLAQRGSYHVAFAVLAVPAALNLLFVFLARLLYPTPEEMKTADKRSSHATQRFPSVFWLYVVGAGLVAAGFADYPIIAFHWAREGVLGSEWIPIFYAVAMAVSGGGSLLMGRLFDRYGFVVLIGLTCMSALFAPLVFLVNHFVAALLGVALWGLGMGVHESIIPAAVAPMIAAGRRASAFGAFTALYGVCWFAGSAAIGWLYDRSIVATVVFCLLVQAAAILVFMIVRRKLETE
ncbi:MFS transporter [Paraburkholderia sp. C35]|uniref:MFS transporter n=1 Tax=Paraburkholderia sp. C35 TaxID=2126993 RepID=UPI001951A616|nr:MFS transporter [Paraburkholderia sp. C35]